MMKRGFLAFRYMLADSAPYYLPALFLSCLGWIFAFHLHGSLKHRPFLRRLYMLAPPILVFGLLISRATDLFSLNSSHPEVALMLGDKATFQERVLVLFTGQGGIEGGLLALLVFSLLSPRLPSLRSVSTQTAEFVQSRLMTYAGWWSIVVLMMLFPQEGYTPLDLPPASPTMALPDWSVLASTVLFTLLLMMSGEIITASAHLASNGETQLLFQRALLKSIVAGLIGWACLAQTDAFTSSWWARPMTDNRLAMAIVIALVSALLVGVHAFSTVAEGLEGPALKQAQTLTWSVLISAVSMVVLTAVMADGVSVYGNGTDALLLGWRWMALAMFVGVSSMILPMAGFDAAHHPEAWWFRISLTLFIPFSVLASNGAWLLFPAIVMAGAAQSTVYLATSIGRITHPVVALSFAVWTGHFVWSIVAENPEQTMGISLFALGFIAVLSLAWLRHERNAGSGKTTN
tara:strand:+ start:518 stop:1900 length:1383 start_codon:yes stop_codon:yes gene_type:complete